MSRSPEAIKGLGLSGGAIPPICHLGVIDGDKNLNIETSNEPASKRKANCDRGRPRGDGRGVVVVVVVMVGGGNGTKEKNEDSKTH